MADFISSLPRKAASVSLRATAPASTSPTRSSRRVSSSLSSASTWSLTETNAPSTRPAPIRGTVSIQPTSGTSTQEWATPRIAAPCPSASMARMRSATLGITAGMREEDSVRASIADDAHE